MYHEKLPIDSEKLDGGFREFENFERACQLFAVWSEKKSGGQQNYIDFFPTVSNLEREAERYLRDILLCSSSEDLDRPEKLKLILAVEGADLLCGNITRLYELYKRKVRVLTLMWSGENCVGGGHDTDKGLCDFGKLVVDECAKLGIIVDLSHASRETFEDVASCNPAPFIASHSNAYSICPHTRNLTDDEFIEICRRDGLVGINLHAPFLIPGADTYGHTPEELFDACTEHILYFLSLGGEKTLCLGADRDGIPHFDGYTPARCIDKLYEKLIKCHIDERIIKDIFSGNAKRFFEKHLPPKERI